MQTLEYNVKLIIEYVYHGDIYDLSNINFLIYLVQRIILMYINFIKNDHISPILLYNDNY